MESILFMSFGIAMMVVGALYLLIYSKKKEKNTHRDVKYKIIFTSIFIILSIPILYLAFQIS